MKNSLSKCLTWIYTKSSHTSWILNLMNVYYILKFLYWKQGCMFNLKFIFLPPPSWFIFFPSLFCCSFVNFKWVGEKICILFTNWGKNMYFPPLFSSPFNHFFPPNMLFGHIFTRQKLKNIQPFCILYNKGRLNIPFWPRKYSPHNLHL